MKANEDIISASVGELRERIAQLSPAERRYILDWIHELARREKAEKRREAQARPAKRARNKTLRSAVMWSLFTLVGFFLLDGAIFRSGWYLQYLEPDSSTGTVEAYMHWLGQSQRGPQPEIMVIGDSRIAEGFSSLAAGAAQPNYRFWNFGIGGTSPRDWYYMLRDADPDRHRFTAIVIALDRYADRDRGDSVADRIQDESYLIGRLRLTDCWDFSRSFSATNRYAMLSGCVFRATTLRNDLHDFLLTRKDRVKRSRDNLKKGLGYIDGYGGKPEDLEGLSVDWVNRTITFPEGTKDWQRSSVKGSLLPDPVPQTGELTRYREYWFGRIMDLYAGTGARVIFVEYPRGPLPTPDDGVPETFVRSVAGRRNVVIVPEQTFRDLEQPLNFADGAHLNHVARPIFSQRLAREVTSILDSH